jgi:hypothetical protein
MTLSRCPAVLSQHSEQGKRRVGHFWRPKRSKSPGQSAVPRVPPYGRRSVWDTSSTAGDAGR